MLREYVKKAASSDPSNSMYAYTYATLLQDKKKRDSLLVEIAWRFPLKPEGVLALEALADNTSGDECSVYYTILYERWLFYKAGTISSQSAEYYEGAMASYFNQLIRSNTIKAYELALRMTLEVKKNRHRWRHKLEVSQGLAEGEKLMNQKNYKDALEVLGKIRVKSSYYDNYVPIGEKIELLKARAADALGLISVAYDSLRVFYCNEPSDSVYAALNFYGTKLGKDSVEVHRDLLRSLTVNKEAATDFTLEKYDTKEKITLSTLKGHVVFLTYWFPGCPPCQREFPHFENVIRKFKDQGVIYLGINGIRSEDEYVLPFMKNQGYSFIPLKETANRDKGNLPAYSYPTNYLIDKEGRVIYQNFRIDKYNESMLEQMILSLL